MAWWRKFFGNGQRQTEKGGGGSLHPQPWERGDAKPASLPGAAAAGTLPETEVLGVTPSGVEVRGFGAPAAELVGWWHRLRAEHPTTGLWPVLIGGEVGDLFAALTPESRDDYDDAAQLRRAEGMSVEQLRALRTERLAAYGDGGDDEGPEALEPSSVVRHAPTFTVAEEDGIVALVPAVNGWQVPVVLGWEGGVNYDVEPVDHGVVLRDWSERFGAELVSLSGDQVLELLVRRPPVSPTEALALAREQYEYCADVVDQGVGSISALAQDQVGSESWFFWWD